jgi:tRNA threonylcarbamoyladenosine biosynthesis protein TsaE
VKLALPDEAATVALGRHLLAVLPADLANWTILLQGELGAGKSTLARALINAAGHTGPVPSPTYTLVEPYELPRGNLYHIDLYRVSDEDELQYLGWDDLGDGCRLVEWPERVAGLEEQADLMIRLRYAGDGREVEITGLSDRGSALLVALAATYPED